MSDSVKLVAFVVLSGLLHLVSLTGDYHAMDRTIKHSDIKIAFVSGDGAAFRAKADKKIIDESKQDLVVPPEKSTPVKQVADTPTSARPEQSQKVAVSQGEGRGKPLIGQIKRPAETKIVDEKSEPRQIETAEQPVSDSGEPAQMIQQKVPLPDFEVVSKLFPEETSEQPAGNQPSRVEDVAGATNSNADEVEVPAVELALPLYDENPKPVYPKIAALKGWEGTVLLEVLVREDGQVEEVSLLNSSGYRVLDKAARTTVYRWRFKPAQAGGVPVECKVQIPISFVLNPAHS